MLRESGCVFKACCGVRGFCLCRRPLLVRHLLMSSRWFWGLLFLVIVLGRGFVVAWWVVVGFVVFCFELGLAVFSGWVVVVVVGGGECFVAGWSVGLGLGVVLGGCSGSVLVVR